jgi:hypothetical protein
LISGNSLALTLSEQNSGVIDFQGDAVSAKLGAKGGEPLGPASCAGERPEWNRAQALRGSDTSK